MAHLYNQKPWLSDFLRVVHQDISTNTTLCGAQWSGIVWFLLDPRMHTLFGFSCWHIASLCAITEKAECQNREAFCGINTRGIFRPEHLLIHMFLLWLLFSFSHFHFHKGRDLLYKEWSWNYFIGLLVILTQKYRKKILN